MVLVDVVATDSYGKPVHGRPTKEDEFDRLFVFHHTGPTSGAVVTLRYCDCP
jgi:hypothetical protein